MKQARHATGVDQVFVNGVQVLRDGEHTGAASGCVVRGPDWRGDRTSARHAGASVAVSRTIFSIRIDNSLIGIMIPDQD
ncbi:MAG: hypothetical protein L0H23_04490 [Luteimonas sp.]|nr:hypothetical protein [Luteimonas sp.]